MSSRKTDIEKAAERQDSFSGPQGGATRREFLVATGATVSAAGLGCAFPVQKAEVAQQAVPAPTPERVRALEAQLGVKRPSFRYQLASGTAASRHGVTRDFPRPSEAETAYKSVADALNAPWREQLKANAIANAAAGEYATGKNARSPIEARLALAFAVGARRGGVVQAS